MNWKLIFLLSLFGPVVALAGIYGFVGFDKEPYLVLGVLFFIAVIVAFRKRRNRFYNAFFAVILFGIMMSFVRLMMLNVYVNNNDGVMEKVEDMLHKVSFIRSPLLILGVMTILAAVFTGGLSFVIGKFRKK